MTMQDYVSAHDRKQQLAPKSMPLGQRLSIVKTIKKSSNIFGEHS